MRRSAAFDLASTGRQARGHCRHDPNDPTRLQMATLLVANGIDHWERKRLDLQDGLPAWENPQIQAFQHCGWMGTSAGRRRSMVAAAVG